MLRLSLAVPLIAVPATGDETEDGVLNLDDASRGLFGITSLRVVLLMFRFLMDDLIIELVSEQLA